MSDQGDELLDAATLAANLAAAATAQGQRRGQEQDQGQGQAQAPQGAAGGQQQGPPIVPPGQDADRAALQQALDDAVRHNRDLQAQLNADGTDGVLAGLDTNPGQAIPLYSNGPQDLETAEQWLNTVKTVKGVKGWTDTQALQACTLNLKGNAKVWAKRMQRKEGDEGIATLALFTKHFLTRFRAHKTPAEIISLISTLKQGPKEDVLSFWDRVDESVYEATRTTRKTLEGKAEQLIGAEALRGGITRQFFVAGLHPHLQELISAQLTTLGEEKALLLKAVELQDAHKKAKSNMNLTTLAEMDGNLPLMEQLLSAMRNGQGRRNPQGGRGSGGPNASRTKNSRPASSNTSAPNQNQPRRAAGSSDPTPSQADKIAKRREWVFCFRCFTWGKHFQRECKATDQELRTLQQQDGRTKPTGLARDRYYH